MTKLETRQLLKALEEYKRLMRTTHPWNQMKLLKRVADMHNLHWRSLWSAIECEKELTSGK